MNGELIVTGIIMIAAIYWFSHIYMIQHPELNNTIQNAKNTCNFDPLTGAIPQNDTANPICTQYGIYNSILKWEPAFYILGAISLIFGFLSSGKKERVEVVREIYHEPQRDERPLIPSSEPENPPTI